MFRAVEAQRPAALVLATLLTLAGLWAYASQPRRALPFVPIEDGKTIDFSSGRPAVHDGPAERAAMDAAVKRMDEAAKDVTFPPDPQKPK